MITCTEYKQKYIMKKECTGQSDTMRASREIQLHEQNNVQAFCHQSSQQLQVQILL